MPLAALRNYEKSATTVEELQALHECLSKLRANYDPSSSSSSSTVSYVVSPAFSGRDDIITASTPSVYTGWCQEETHSYKSTFLELDPTGCPQPGSSWMSYDEIGLDSESTNFVDSLWSDSNPDL